MGVGLALQAIGLGWIAAVSTPTVPYMEPRRAVHPVRDRHGLFFAPVANVILGSVRRREEGQASGANNAIRELGGVFGVAVLASIFASVGGYGSGEELRRRPGPRRLGRCGGRRDRRDPRAHDPGPSTAR